MSTGPFQAPDEEFILLYLEDLQERNIDPNNFGFDSYEGLGRGLIQWFILGKEGAVPLRAKSDFNRFLKHLDETPSATKRTRGMVFSQEFTKPASQIPEELLHREIVRRRMEFTLDTLTPTIKEHIE